MSERSGAELPPGWTVLQAGATAGRLYVAVWRAFPDATSFEYGYAMARAPGPGLLRPEDAVARLGALREARRQRPDPSDDTWQQLVEDVAPKLSGRQRQDPGAIGAAVQEKIDASVEVSGPALGAGRPGGAPRLPEDVVRRELEAALDRLQEQGIEQPTREAIAGAHSPELGVRGLQKRLAAHPHLRDLLPRKG